MSRVYLNCYFAPLRKMSLSLNPMIIIIIIIVIISVMELGHLLTRSGLTYPQVSSKVYHDSFCQLGSSISLPWVPIFVVLYGCETWSLILREKRKLRVSENMVLRRIFGPRRDEVTGEWRRLHNEELNDLYSSPNIVWVIKSRKMRWAGHVARMGEERGAYRVLVGKPDEKRPLGRPRRRWLDNIRMDLQEVGCGYVDWIGLAQDRDRWRTLVSAIMNLWVP